MKKIELKRPVLFLEFYVREVSYYSSEQATDFPPHTLFYTGKSLAAPQEDDRLLSRSYQAKFGRKPVFGFKSNEPCLLDAPNVVENFRKESQRKSVLDTVLLVGHESFLLGRWKRSSDQLLFSYSNHFPYLEVGQKAPYGFNIQEVDEAGVVKTRFPRLEIVYNLAVNQTYLFLCRKEEFASGEWVTPTVCLSLFVKNHGFHQQVQLFSELEILQLNAASLCEEAVKVRDHRKSRFKYTLG